jgi:hypothetical protein
MTKFTQPMFLNLYAHAIYTVFLWSQNRGDFVGRLLCACGCTPTRLPDVASHSALRSRSYTYSWLELRTLVVDHSGTASIVRNESRASC